MVACAALSFTGGSAIALAAAGQPAPVVEQTLEPSTPTPAVGQPVAFNLATSSAQGPITSNAVWNFGDGQSETIFGGSAVHVYSSPGVYNVTVTGTSQSGQPVSASTTVRVAGSAASSVATTTNALPGTVAAITALTMATALPPTSVAIVNPPTSGAVDQPLTFTAANAVSPNACGTIASYVWDFGDGTPEITGQTVAHAYTTPGNYNVNLNVTDCSGASASASTQVHIAALPPGVPVSYAAGWNLVAGAPGTTIVGASGPLYTLQAGDTTYETVSAGAPLMAGEGYWAYFPTASTGSIPTSTGALTVPLPASAYVMIGNSDSVPATVSGADLVLIYNPSSGYTPATTLQPGQGAWAFSFSGGVATITPQS